MTDHEPVVRDDTPPIRERSTSRWSTLIPAAALLIGLLIGGVVVGVSDGGDIPTTDPQPTDSPTLSATTDPNTAATIVVVPDECLAAVDTVEQLTDLVGQGAAAIRDFRTAELRSLLRELETLDKKARQQAQACRNVRTEESPSTE